MLNEINENQEILDELKEKIKMTAGDLERENYKNILLKSYSLENVLEQYKTFNKKLVYGKDVNDYKTNLTKDYILFNLSNKYKQYLLKK